MSVAVLAAADLPATALPASASDFRSNDQRVLFFGDAAVPHDPRLAQLDHWLNGLFGARDFAITTASADASFRRYFRVTRAAQTWIAMDAPPEKEDMEPYIRIAAMLVDVGVNAPRVLQRESGQGFLLNSDLGSRTYLMRPRCRAPTPIALYRMPSRRWSAFRLTVRRTPSRLPPTMTPCCVVKWGCFPNGSAAVTWPCS